MPNPELLRLSVTSEASNAVQMKPLPLDVIVELGEPLDNFFELVDKPIDTVHANVGQLEGPDRLDGLWLVGA